MDLPHPEMPFKALPKESADALINSFVTLLQEEGITVSAEMEILPSRNDTLSMFVITLPEGLTPQQQAEVDYWANEILPLFRYASDTTSPYRAATS